MIVYPPIFYGAELKLTFKGKLTWKVADTLQLHLTWKPARKICITRSLTRARVACGTCSEW